MSTSSDLRERAAQYTAAAAQLTTLAEQQESLEKEIEGVLSGAPLTVAASTSTPSPKAKAPSTTGTGRGRGRPKGSTNKNTEGGERAKNAVSLKELITQILTKKPSGLPLAGLVEEIKNRGYQSTATGKGFVAVVYQNLHKLQHNDKTVEKDESVTPKKFKLIKSA